MKGLLWDFRCGKLGAALFPRGWSHGKKKKTTLMKGLNLWQDHGSPLSDLFFFLWVCSKVLLPDKFSVL